MLHASLTEFGVVRGTSRELVDAAASVLAAMAELPIAIPRQLERSVEPVAV